MKKLIHIEFEGIELEGMLSIPDGAQGLVLFAHGSGSSRFSPRNNFVADKLNEGRIGTLLIDLLSPQEEAVYMTRFDIELLSKRLGLVVDWLQKQPNTKPLMLGLFGASTGAAAALFVAAKMKSLIKAVVSRGGRPDLALPVLNQVVAPTLLIVGGNDDGVIELNEKALALLPGIKKLEIVPNATHLFEEPGCLELVAQLAKSWFVTHLS